jgi:uncharacterized protein (DUF488 family)
MPSIYTIGYTQKSLERFIRLLQNAGVDSVVDIRLRNTSQLAGFAKRDDLAFLLREGFGIAYEHRPDLAPTPELLDAYRATRDWPAYEHGFLRLLGERQVEIAGRQVLSRWSRPCLLCAEPKPDRCHRRLVAEWWAQHLAGIDVVHL